MEILCGLDDIAWLVKNFGLLFLVIVFFVWRDYRREDKLTKRIEKLEDEHRDIVLPLVEETTEVVVRNTEALRLNAIIIERLERVLDRQ